MTLYFYVVILFFLFRAMIHCAKVDTHPSFREPTSLTPVMYRLVHLMIALFYISMAVWTIIVSDSLNQQAVQ